ncbi:MAG: hypothetical protein N2C14_30065, partial [Planctomycetales bacterium]
TRTIFHEATHQIFSETRKMRNRKAALVGVNGNFWIIEGIACYMESLRERDGMYTLGGFDNPRMVAAHYHLANPKRFFVHLEELTSLDIQRFQKHPNIAKLYSQGTGVASFLMHHDGGRYRPALMQYLRDVYHGVDTRHSLAKHTGVSFDQLDREYIEYMLDGMRRAKAKIIQANQG